MAEAVYLLNFLASLSVAVLLFRGYSQSRARLLFWSALCFVGLALNNALLFVDLVLLPTVDLTTVRSVAALAGMLVLLFGLIWEGA